MKLKVRIVYGVCSYGVAAALLLIPYFLTSASDAARIIAFIAGGFLLSAALLTDYELGVSPLLRFRESASYSILGSIAVLITIGLLNYGKLVWLILIAALVQCLVSGFAFRIHNSHRQRVF